MYGRELLPKGWLFIITLLIMWNLCVDGEGVKWQREVIGGDVDPGASLTNFNDRGGPTEVHILYQKKITIFKMCLLKKVTTFF